MAKEAHNLTDLLSGIAEKAQHEQIELGEILTAFGRRSHGPLLFLPAFLAAAPTGAIPGVAIGAAILIALISVQMILFPGAPWLPRRFMEIELPAETVERSVTLSRPVARFIDRLLAPRLKWILHPAFVYGVAALSLVMAVVMVPFAFIPFAASLPGVAVALFGLALTSEDGVTALLAVGFTLASIALAVYLLM